MARIAKVQPLVYAALVEKPETRKDDFLLILEVLKHFVTTDIELETILKQHVELGIPSFASIIRVRRKLQEEYPELEDPAAVAIRQAEEEEFKTYARLY